MTRLVASILCGVVALIDCAGTASAMTIEKIVSPSGIEAWLVREKAVPLVTLNYAFHGGATQDGADKAGTANLAADLLDEGAGNLDSKAYHERLENHAIELGFQVGRDYIHGSLRALTEHRDEAFELLRLALSSPRFDADAVERVRGQQLAALQRDTTNPRQPPLVANRVPRPSLWSRNQGNVGDSATHYSRRSARLCASRVRAQ